MSELLSTSLSIRLATLEDAVAVQAIYAPHVLDSATSFETEVPTVAEVAERISSTLVYYPWLVYEEDGQVVGYAYASAHRARAAYGWAAEVSVYIAESHQRRGIGRRLYAALFERLIQQGFYTAIAGITLPNPGSVGLHESLGFTHVGTYHNIGYKAGAWRDVGWWEKALQAHGDGPPNPTRGHQELE